MTTAMQDPKTFIQPIPVWLNTYPIALQALGYAAEAHRSQKRKYTGEAYVNHCLDVMIRVYNLYNSFGMDAPENMLAACAMHDTVEDTDTNYNDLELLFGKDITSLVFWLTDVCTKEHGNREVRKRLEAERLRYAPIEAKIIKFCDIASNTESIVAHDAGFAKTYLPEKQRILDVIGEITWAMLADTIHPDFRYTAIN